MEPYNLKTKRGISRRFYFTLSSSLAAGYEQPVQNRRELHLSYSGIEKCFGEILNISALTILQGSFMSCVALDFSAWALGLRVSG